jgi:mono/diheme cytochrome c family protein
MRRPRLTAGGTFGLLLAVVPLLGGASRLSADPPATAEPATVAFFETRIRAALAANCFECHGPRQQKAKLRLDSRAAVLAGGRSGPAVTPGRPEESLLVSAIRHDEALQMPPKRKLPPRAVADLTAWVKMGAPWPDAGPAMPGKATAPGSAFTDEQKSFWAFRPPAAPPLPVVKDRGWARSPLDLFVLARLQDRGLAPAPPADRRTLIRRTTFDLTGLPPTPDEVSAFLNDSSPDAFARVVDRLLASPHYGERWARYWLDVARYADSNGMDENLAYANAWRYRDWVVRAFNRDLPYDQFVRAQLAGDLLPAASPADAADLLTATGFLVIGPKMLAEDDPVKMEMDIIDEQVDTVGRAFLGLTLGCARCHDHKFDPIAIGDYYALAGIFKSTKTMDHFRVVARWQERSLAPKEQQDRARVHADRVAKLKAQVDKLARTGPKRTEAVPANLKRLQAELAALQKAAPVLPEAMAVSEDRPVNLRIHLRGSHLTLGAEVPRRFPRILAGDSRTPVGGDRSGRLELARWLTRPDNPLTARVLVNRIWQAHFGTGLVRSPDNFGRLGERPDNPQLLDWLAVRFVESGWSIKALHRLILLSSTYQMSTAFDTRAARLDPENRLHWRHDRRRLEAEALRDALLTVGGGLDRTMGGSLFQGANRAYVPGYPNSNYDRYDFKRRSIYLPVIRSDVYAVFQAFDFADPSMSSGQRATTTVAPQALFLMNGKLVLEQARALARDLLGRQDLDDTGRVRLAYERAYARLPSAQETARALRFVQEVEKALPVGAERRQRAWQSLCRVLVAADEFIYVE